MLRKDRKCHMHLGCCLHRWLTARPYHGRVRTLALRLYEDKCSTFSRLIHSFIACTRESREQDPHAVMRSVRQFVSGMKNFLRAGEAHKLFEKRRNVSAEEEAEEVLQELVVVPLQEHISRLLDEKLASTGSSARLAGNMAAARHRTPQELGAGDHVPTPCMASLDALCRILTRLRHERAPSGKLRNLVACVHALLIEVTSCSDRRCGTMSGDDLLPMLVMLVAHSGMTTAETEAEYMWGLLDRTALFSEGGYYLTTFSCAVQAIKNLPQQHLPLLPL